MDLKMMTFLPGQVYRIPGTLSGFWVVEVYGDTAKVVDLAFPSFESNEGVPQGFPYHLSTLPRHVRNLELVGVFN